MTGIPPEELERLVRETRTLAEDNNRLLRLIRRDALIGTILKIVIWLLVLGVPLFFLSKYIGPILDGVSGTGTGFPPPDQVLNALMEAYQQSQ